MFYEDIDWSTMGIPNKVGVHVPEGIALGLKPKVWSTLGELSGIDRYEAQKTAYANRSLVTIEVDYFHLLNLANGAKTLEKVHPKAYYEACIKRLEDCGCAVMSERELVEREIAHTEANLLLLKSRLEVLNQEMLVSA